jgi:Protein of unknown function (DUF3866)
MLKLRRGVVTSTDPLRVEVEGSERPAWADRTLIGEIEPGDEVIVNTEALDLALGSGGFDLVHANLTRGLSGEGADGHVMKLNYTSLQHSVEPMEAPLDEAPDDTTASPPAAAAERGPAVLVIPLHGHLAPAAWAAAQALPELAVGYIQTSGGALPGALSRDVVELRSRGLLAGHVTAGAAYGGEREAVGVLGALDAAAGLEWRAVIAGPGPGILGSATRYGHGGMRALDTAHAALALRLPTLISPRLSGTDRRPRHRGLSHHTSAVLGLLLAPIAVPVPEVEATAWPTPEGSSQPGPEPGMLDELREACGERHDMVVHPVDLEGYARSGLPARAMGRGLDDDPLFFAAALAAGRALAAATASAEAKR